jgi:hypothetical protein
MHAQQPFTTFNGFDVGDPVSTSLNINYGNIHQSTLGDSCGSVAIPASCYDRKECRLVAPVPSNCLTTDVAVDLIAYSNFGIARLDSVIRG